MILVTAARANPNVLTWLLGRPPTTFEAYVRNQQDARRTARMRLT